VNVRILPHTFSACRAALDAGQRPRGDRLGGTGGLRLCWVGQNLWERTSSGKSGAPAANRAPWDHESSRWRGSCVAPQTAADQDPRRRNSACSASCPDRQSGLARLTRFLDVRGNEAGAAACRRWRRKSRSRWRRKTCSRHPQPSTTSGAGESGGRHRAAYARVQGPYDEPDTQPG